MHFQEKVLHCTRFDVRPPVCTLYNRQLTNRQREGDATRGGEGQSVGTIWRWCKGNVMDQKEEVFEKQWRLIHLSISLFSFDMISFTIGMYCSIPGKYK